MHAYNKSLWCLYVVCTHSSIFVVPSTTVLPAVFSVSVFCWYRTYQICWIFGISVGITSCVGKNSSYDGLTKRARTKKAFFSAVHFCCWPAAGMHVRIYLPARARWAGAHWRCALATREPKHLFRAESFFLGGSCWRSDLHDIGGMNNINHLESFRLEIIWRCQWTTYCKLRTFLYVRNTESTD